jgi:formylglycine-generating enzyme required for sulfatase activity
MKRHVLRGRSILSLAFFSVASSIFGQIAITSVPVGNPGNANDATGLGAVAYNYRIGAHEVTNDQYAAFLNVKAASDPFDLYNTSMGSNSLGGISRSGSTGAFTYTVRANMGNKPVNFVSWYDAIRFTNWLHNGQSTADTETGAYTLGALGAGGVPVNGDAIIRNSNAIWFLPTENEWYKAAFYHPATASYFDYPTGSDNIPALAATALAGNGDVTNPGPNVANYGNEAFWGGRVSVTTVGSAGSTSVYGTYDQGGNASEWNEELKTVAGFPGRSQRGGDFTSGSSALKSTATGNGNPSTAARTIGFRVARTPLMSQPADFDDDGDVDGADFLTWQRHLGINNGSAQRANGDANGDGNVTGADLVSWRAQFGPAAVAAGRPAPEPTGLAIAIFALLTVSTRLRRLHSGR